MGSVKIEFANVSDMLRTDLGKGDLIIANTRKNLVTMKSDYQNAIGVYTTILSTASKYLDMAKALGDDGMIGRLSKDITDANEMIKISNSAINKISSI